MANPQGWVEGKLTMKNKISITCDVKKVMAENQIKIFKETCFSVWLNLEYMGNDPGLVHAMLQRKTVRPERIDDDKYPEKQDDIWFRFKPNFSIRFGHREFCLVTGFLFGTRTDMAHYIPKNYEKEMAPIRQRLFPSIKESTNILIGDIEKKLLKSSRVGVSDDDVVRLAIILVVERAFMGKQSSHVVNKKFLYLVEDFSSVNKYPWGLVYENRLTKWLVKGLVFGKAN
ncbi:uncharacterized protein [Rutidosis leptorrhynchoides]|uniref:uncharacterized protein n=1 Tax=Rutidosis leptorrhynchoides TaxID=125765 RepID=UPI003A9A5801